MPKAKSVGTTITGQLRRNSAGEIKARTGQMQGRRIIYGSIRDERGVVVGGIEEAATLELDKQELAERASHAFAFEAVRNLVPGSGLYTSGGIAPGSAEE